MSNALSINGDTNLQQSPLRGRYFADLLCLKNTFEFEHRFDRKLAAGLSAWTNDGTDANNIASGFDPYWKATLSAGTYTQTVSSYGITIGTRLLSAASGDDFIFQPHTVAATSWLGTTGFNSPNLGFDSWVSYVVRTSSTITSQEIFVGQGNAIASVISSTDNQDQVGFVYNPANSPNWRGVVVKDGTQTFTDTGIAVAASTSYLLTYKINQGNNSVEFFIDGVKVGTSSATVRSLLDNGSTAVSFVPFGYIETKTNAQREMTLTAFATKVDLLS